ncbi:unnamed protein product, partial [Owenia fusiformis]
DYARFSRGPPGRYCPSPSPGDTLSAHIQTCKPGMPQSFSITGIDSFSFAKQSLIGFIEGFISSRKHVILYSCFYQNHQIILQQCQLLSEILMNLTSCSLNNASDIC